MTEEEKILMKIAYPFWNTYRDRSMILNTYFQSAAITAIWVMEAIKPDGSYNSIREELIDDLTFLMSVSCYLD